MRSLSAEGPQTMGRYFPAQGWLSRTDLVGEDEGHHGLVTGLPGDAADELQHGRDPWNTVSRQAGSPPL